MTRRIPISAIASSTTSVFLLAVHPPMDRFRSFFLEPSDALGHQIEPDHARTPLGHRNRDRHPDGLARRDRAWQLASKVIQVQERSVLIVQVAREAHEAENVRPL